MGLFEAKQMMRTAFKDSRAFSTPTYSDSKKSTNKPFICTGKKVNFDIIS